MPPTRENPIYLDVRRVIQRGSALTDDERILLRALTFAPGAHSTGKWIRDIEEMNQEAVRLDEFVERCETLVKAQLVEEDPHDAGCYRMTPLGYCVAIRWP